MKGRPKLVVVANRGPYRAGPKGRLVRAAGGLVAALDPVLRERGGLWVSAQETDSPLVVEAQGEVGYDMAQVALTRAVQQGFYRGVSNAILWPLLHSFPPTQRVGAAPWASYETANRAFADVILENSSPRDLLWVHDFHLMLVPGMLRAARKRARIGWFCHIPWPSQDLFKILPWRDFVLEGLLGADVLQFHTEQYARNFLRCIEFLTDYRVDHASMTIKVGARHARVMVAPIGVPFDELQTLAADPAVQGAVGKLKDAVGGRSIVLGVDRLDYTKGIPERILAYEQFLKSDRSARNRYVFVQVMVPSRTDIQAYSDLKDEIDRMVGDINGRFGATGRVPIHYLFRNLTQQQLLAHYCAADVALVTPLRDGMNLVAHEYAASRSDGGGVLILSELAGAAEFLTEALVVNAYDIGAMANAIQRAVRMPPTERQRRMSGLRAQVHKLDVHLWADSCVRAVEDTR